MTIDEPSRSLVDAYLALGLPAMSTMTPDQARATAGDPVEVCGLGPEMKSVEQHVVACDDGDGFVVRVLIPYGDLESAIVYLHGGGWVLGSIDEYDTLGRKLAVLARSVVLLVGYRKAPEAPHPAAVDDAHASLRWLHDRLPALVGRQLPLVVAGDSAGGNLAIVSALRATEVGPRLAMCALIYPVVDTAFDTPSYLAEQNQLLLTRDRMQWFVGHYLADGGDPTDPRIAPLRAESLHGFPPTVVFVASHDPLRDEGVAFARRLDDVGSLVDLEEFTDQMHGFFQFVNQLPGSDVALARLATRIHDHLTTSRDSTPTERRTAS